MKKQTMFRVNKDKNNPYVMLNKEFLGNKNLSWKAKGILSYLLSLPDDWQIYESELSKHSTDGISSLKSGIKELIESGYINRIQLRNDKGQFVGYEYEVYEVPTEIRKSDNGESNDGNSYNGKSHTTNNNLPNNDLEGYKGSDESPRCVFSFVILDKQIEKIMNSISDNGVIGNLDTNDIKEFFRMYYNYGGHIRNIKPTKLKNEQIEHIITSIAYIDEVDYNPTLDDYEKILIDYFNQDFPNCDYGINHFISGNVLLMRYYNLRPLLE